METNKIHNLIKVCPLCKKEYKVRSPSEIDTRKYCSKKCQVDATKKDKVIVICEICQKFISVPFCLAETTKFCSRKCKGIALRKIKDPDLRQCNKCGKILVTKDDFYSTNSTYEYRCKNCQKERSLVANRTPLGRIRIGKSIAKKRGYEWIISYDDYVELIKCNKCHYCGDVLDKTGCGLDRKGDAPQGKPCGFVRFTK
jgi:endogenous inhibitor of DNA gyrase (YacG/DUF329 family)